MSSPTSGAITTKNGGLWVFPEGPNHPGQYIGCIDMGDVTEPQGDMTLLQCFDVWGKWKTVGTKTSPPDKVTTTLTQLTFQTRTWLERNKGVFGLMLLDRDGGRADVFTNWVRALILQEVRATSKKYGALLHHIDDNESTRDFDVSAQPPVIDVVRVSGRRISTSEVDAFNDVAMLKTDVGILPYKYGAAVSDGHTAVEGYVWLTDDGGASWVAAAAQPFAVVEDIEAVGILDMGNNLRRIIAAKAAPAGAQGQYAYSDDWGATWTLKSLGGATAGHGPVKGGAICALDYYHVWMCSAAGFIYFSSDGGVTFAAQESGVVTAGDYQQIKMTDDGQAGYACAETGVVAKSVDGINWVACPATIASTPDVLSLFTVDEDHAWVGTATGGLWWTEDGGATWTSRAGWIGAGVGTVDSIIFVSDYVGFMVRNTASPVGYILRTIDGGYTWQVLTADANSGLTIISAGDENYAVYTGLVNTALGFLGIVSE